MERDSVLKSVKESRIIQKIISYWKVDVYRATILRFGTIGFRSIVALVFWSFIGNLFQAEGVGIASSVVSVLRLGAFFTMFGIQTAFLKFPLLSIKRNQLTKILSVPFFLNFIASIVYLTAFDYLRVLISFSRLNWILMSFAISLTISFFLILDDVLVGIMKPWFLLVKEIVTDIALLAGVLISIFLVNSTSSPATMVLVWGLSQVIGIIVTIIYLIIQKRKTDSYESVTLEQPVDNNEIDSTTKGFQSLDESELNLKNFFTFSFNNYTGTLLQTLPNLLTTSIIIILFSSVDAAYIYIAWSIMGLLGSLPNSLSFVLVTQKSDTTSKTLFKRVQFSFIINTLFVVPFALLQKQIFLLFKIPFTTEYYWSFLIILLSGYPLSIFLIYISALRRKNERGMLQTLFLIQGIAYFSFLFILKPFIGIMAVNLAWLIANIIMATISIIFSIKKGKIED